MSHSLARPPSDPGPPWEVARLFPNQGHWAEGDYLELNRRSNHLVELTDGRLEVLEMPTRSHQRIVLFLYERFREAVAERGLGEVLVAPYPVRLWEGKFREPDLVVVLSEHAAKLGEDFAEGADLVVEVVSEDRRRDLETKRAEYARAGIGEYWIVDPLERRVTVLRLTGHGYAVHAESGPSQPAVSSLLHGFIVDAGKLFAAMG